MTPTIAKIIAATRRYDRDDGAFGVPRLSLCALGRDDDDHR
jgi:hypothetical protein